jgi:hypothetical protein
MKKMIFSAVALIAFSFAGVANEIEEKKVEIKTIEMEKVEEIEIATTSCAKAYLQDFERYENMGLTFYWAGEFAFHNYKKCTGTL